MSTGWIKLYRKLQDNPLWLSEPFTRSQAWIDLLFLANFTPSSYYIRGNKIEVKRGELAWSEDKLAERWKWSRGKVRSFLKTLKTEQQIEQQKSNIINKIIILNYNSYQEVEQQIEQQKDSRLNNRKTHNKKEKNNKNEKNIIKKGERLPYQSLPNGWLPFCFDEMGWSQEMAETAFLSFYDYWNSPDCKNPLKKDWYTTFKNSCRNGITKPNIKIGVKNNDRYTKPSVHDNFTEGLRLFLEDNQNT